MSEFSPNPKSLGNGEPVTGTAIYLTSDPAGWEKTWALWTSIVSTVPVCIGVMGGWMVEPVEGKLSYIVYVGWDSIAVHDSYHHTKHFRQRAIILREHKTRDSASTGMSLLRTPALAGKPTYNVFFV